MSTSADLLYLDSSAIVKLVTEEAESEALTRFVSSYASHYSSALSRVEVIRAVGRSSLDLARRARATLSRLIVLRLDDALLDAATEIGPPPLRALDAIQVAAARTLGPDLAALVTYDLRMIEAAEDLGIPAISPGR